MWPRFHLMTAFAAGLVAVVLVMALGSLWVWQHAINDRVEALRSERFRFSLMDLKSTLEAGLRLGNTMADLTGTDALVAQARDRQPDILSIDVYDAQGGVLFSTDPGARGLKIPAAWQPPCLNPDTSGWAGLDADGGVQCIGLANAFGQPAGGVLLRHRFAAGTTAGLTVPADWPILTAIMVALMAGIGVLATRAMNPLHQRANALMNQLASLNNATPSSPTRPTPPTDDLGPAAAALQAMQAHDLWLKQTDAEADQLDAQEAA